MDLLTLAGHKMYAPKGIGALYVHTGLDLEPTIYGGEQEAGRRAGTENVALIVALGHAAHLATRHLDQTHHLRRLRDLLQARLTDLVPGGIQLNGHPTGRLPNTLNISIAGTAGRHLLAATPDIAASTGSACHESIEAPSPVLTAMGQPADRASSAVRLTLGRWTTDTDIDHIVAALTATLSRIGLLDRVTDGPSVSDLLMRW